MRSSSRVRLGITVGNLTLETRQAGLVVRDAITIVEGAGHTTEIDGARSHTFRTLP